MRAIIVCVFIELLSNSGKLYLITYTIRLITNGPIANIPQNSRELLNTSKCLFTIMANVSTEFLKTAIAPISNMIMGIFVQKANYQQISRTAKITYDLLKKEIEEGDTDMTSYDEYGNETAINSDFFDYSQLNKIDLDYKYERPLTQTEQKLRQEKISLSDHIDQLYTNINIKRCNTILERAVMACRQRVIKVERRCLRATTGDTSTGIALRTISFAPGIQLMYLFTGLSHDKLWEKICNMVFSTLNKVCEAVKTLPFKTLGVGKDCDETLRQLLPGIGNYYVETETNLKNLVDAFDTRISYDYKHFLRNETTLLNDPRAVFYDVFESLEETQRYVSWSWSLFNLVQNYLAIWIFIKAWKYVRCYLIDITYENYFITNDFRLIDLKRRKNQRRHLLPLKKLEKQRYIDPSYLKLQGVERGKLLSAFTFNFIVFFIFIILILIDLVMADVVDAVRMHGKIIVHPKAEHNLTILVNGTGFMAKFIRTMFKHLYSNRTVDHKILIEPCLPNVYRLNTYWYTQISIFSFLTIFLTLTSQYNERLQRLTMSFFYPRRERQRTIWLYRKMLRERRLYKQKLIKRALEYWMRNFLLERLTKFSVGRLCNVNYCEDCWIDIEEKCLICEYVYRRQELNEIIDKQQQQTNQNFQFFDESMIFDDIENSIYRPFPTQVE
ncbi:unnamed protein product [Didymodactylos carnosus]|uniref:Dendritic cell-specific transmembrane protein-like domain-containing protein n=1 Tax=Didymodactylos carnosus TaxID=1234261 RepID=A0A815FVK6_9BILA|nr:unnamed protein product [Didymodactylos carnosus]CAF4179614.1 unnamed protein product [Didymodactylos carnosus]